MRSRLAKKPQQFSSSAFQLWLYDTTSTNAPPQSSPSFSSSSFPPKQNKMVSPAFIPAAAHTLPIRTTRAVSTRRAPVMSMRKHAARLAALSTTIATVAPALATEGTGEGLGIDSALLYLPLIGVPAVFLALFLQFDGSQNKEDFLGEYDDRRN